MNQKLKIIFFGTPQLGVQILEKLISAGRPATLTSSQWRSSDISESPPATADITKGFKPIAVVTREDKPVGRGQKPTPPPVKIIAQKYQIPIFQPKKLKGNEEILKSLKSQNADLFVVAAYGRLIPKEILELSKYGTLNIHPSLLPKYRGASPIQSTILAGEKETGVTIILLDQELDHGPIVAQEKIDLAGTETAEDLKEKLGNLGAELLIETIPRYLNYCQVGALLAAGPHFKRRETVIERIFTETSSKRVEPEGRARQGRLKMSETTVSAAIYLPPLPQNHPQATFTKILTKENGQIDLKSLPSPEKFNLMIRAFYPWPGTWTKWSFDSAQGKQEKIVKFLPVLRSFSEVGPDNPFLIQPEGKKPMSIKEFLNGHPEAKEWIEKII